MDNSLKVSDPLLFGCSWEAMLKKDRWLFKEFNLPWYRRCEQLTARSLIFGDVANDESKLAIKTFAMDLIRHRDVRLSTVAAILSVIRNMAKSFPDRSVVKLSRTELDGYMMDVLYVKYGYSYNFVTAQIHRFYQYCLVQGMIDVLPVDFSLYKKRDNRKLMYKAISPEVLTQLMNHMTELDEEHALAFYLVYYASLHLAEVCNLRLDCLAKLKERHYLRIMNKRHREEVFTPIPASLAELIRKQQKRTLKKDENAENLFISLGEGQFYESVREAVFGLVQKYCDNRDEARSFSFQQLRQAYAYRLLRHDVPLVMIQKLLHNRNITTALGYMQTDEQSRKEQYLQFLNVRSEGEDVEKGTSEADVIWMRHVLQQALPNGYCNLPVNLGACPHANACLTCDRFHTTAEFLPVLRYQLVKIENMLKVYESSPGQVNEDVLQRTKAVKVRLTELIAELEAEADGRGLRGEKRG